MCSHQAPPLVRVVAYVGDAGQATPHLEHNPLSLLGACHATPLRKLNDPVLTVNALVASNYCLIPVESGSKYSLDGYEDLEELIRDVRDVNPKLDILGVLITRHDGRKNVCKAMKAAIERRFGDKVFHAAISSSAKIQEAEASKRTIFQHDRQSTGARDFHGLRPRSLGAFTAPTDAFCA